MTKNEYIQDLLKGRVWNPQLLEGALVFWHSGVPFHYALGYIHNLEKKLNREPANP